MRLLNIYVLMVLVGIAGYESREEARRKQAANNLKQIGLALQAFHSQQSEQVDKEESGTSTTPNAEATVRAFSAAEMDAILTKVHKE